MTEYIKGWTSGEVLQAAHVIQNGFQPCCGIDYDDAEFQQHLVKSHQDLKVTPKVVDYISHILTTTKDGRELLESSLNVGAYKFEGFNSPERQFIDALDEFDLSAFNDTNSMESWKSDICVELVNNQVPSFILNPQYIPCSSGYKVRGTVMMLPDQVEAAVRSDTNIVRVSEYKFKQLTTDRQKFPEHDVPAVQFEMQIPTKETKRKRAIAETVASAKVSSVEKPVVTIKRRPVAVARNVVVAKTPVRVLEPTQHEAETEAAVQGLISSQANSYEDLVSQAVTDEEELDVVAAHQESMEVSDDEDDCVKVGAIADEVVFAPSCEAVTVTAAARESENMKDEATDVESSEDEADEYESTQRTVKPKPLPDYDSDDEAVVAPVKRRKLFNIDSEFVRVDVTKTDEKRTPKRKVMPQALLQLIKNRKRKAKCTDAKPKRVSKAKAVVDEKVQHKPAVDAKPVADEDVKRVADEDIKPKAKRASRKSKAVDEDAKLKAKRAIKKSANEDVKPKQRKRAAADTQPSTSAQKPKKVKGPPKPPSEATLSKISKVKVIDGFALPHDFEPDDREVEFTPLRSVKIQPPKKLVKTVFDTPIKIQKTKNDITIGKAYEYWRNKVPAINKDMAQWYRLLTAFKLHQSPLALQYKAITNDSDLVSAVLKMNNPNFSISKSAAAELNVKVWEYVSQIFLGAVKNAQILGRTVSDKVLRGVVESHGIINNRLIDYTVATEYYAAGTFPSDDVLDLYLLKKVFEDMAINTYEELEAACNDQKFNWCLTPLTNTLLRELKLMFITTVLQLVPEIRHMPNMMYDASQEFTGRNVSYPVAFKNIMSQKIFDVE